MKRLLVTCILVCLPLLTATDLLYAAVSTDSEPGIQPASANPNPQFVDIGADLLGVSLGSAAWGDYDNDGDLDVLLTGWVDRGAGTRIYRNDNGVFNQLDANLISMNESYADWGDFDNDGDLDIIISGLIAGSSVSTRIYYNDNGNFVYNYMPLAGTYYSFVNSADYDNDGDLDFLVAGRSNGGGLTRIYRNDGDTFTDIEADLIGVFYANAAWGDYDNDNDLDLLVIGWTGIDKYTRLYRNDDGIFTTVDVGLIDIYSGCVAWGDYDNDGDLDILLSGTIDTSSGFTATTRIYENNAGFFTDIQMDLPPLVEGAVAWGDCDNDGDLDILLSGLDTYTLQMSATIFLNDGGLYFEIDAGLRGVVESAARWGDYDNDGDLDILLAGWTDEETTTFIYRNDSAVPNTPPVAPDGLLAETVGEGVLFSWNQATDAETAQAALSYNLRLGTSPGAGDIFSPMALNSGLRLISALGNTNLNNSWFCYLPPGDYYWSVQTLDNNFAGSTFSPSQGLRVIDAAAPEEDEGTGASETILHLNQPNPFSSYTSVLFDLPQSSPVSLQIFDLSGRLVRQLIPSVNLPSGRHSISWDGNADNGQVMSAGVYLYRLTTPFCTRTERMIRVE